MSVKRKAAVIFTGGLVVLSMMLTQGLCGCSKKGSGYDRVIRYMEKKYGTEFELAGVSATYGTDDSHHVTLSSPEYPGKLITVYAKECKGEVEDLSVSENFPGIRYEAEIRNALEETLVGCYGKKIHLFPELNCGSSSFDDGGKTPGELMARKGFGIRFDVWIQTSGMDHEEISKRLSDAFRKAGITASGRVYCIRNDIDADPALLMRDELKEIPCVYMTFAMDKPGSIEEEEWSE